jgi:hypothetical protein
MPWFVASRSILREGKPTEKKEYRVFSEAEIENVGPEWDWASSVCDSLEEAQQEADDLFWNEFD